MKLRFVWIFLLVLSASGIAEAAFYRWVDGNGVVHFTDNKDNIPAKFRKKATRLKLLDEPSVNAKPATPPQTPAPSPVAAPPAGPELYGDHDQAWWRNRFTTMKGQIQAAKDRLAENQTKLVELRRKRVIYQRTRDREAYNTMNESIAAEEENLSKLVANGEALTQEADRAGVPAEWRQ
ncbi:DUF4124 domain-containing protein [Geomonas sp. Red32]|uniref:DUF4124 domain-containing protein n=1 Tax=Geomonas sp. Red32 TaxID=2912856 RepID=UPI00202CF2FB|nr:DUF4124 domain-containing protein [Geomonas sp. Red32]MCM0083199.1 DUF4124 domain-containing protein [Geomonas sp. Red32]